ncbi:LysR family transcriptional regulator [Pectobacterium peruviense]|nr:LysR family transcriptional regulator [Pectobacterium peruviense]
MMYSSERLKGIDLFVCVADVGSFTSAAEKMNLTSSAVSKGIARLESRLQVRLFDRTTRRLSLSDSGVAFYRTCTSVLADLEEAELAMQSETTDPRGKVRIDLPASFGRLHVLPVILNFIEKHPLLTPHITFSDRFVDPVVEGIDIIVRIGGSNIWSNTLGHRYLGVQQQIFCASPSYLLKNGQPRNRQDLEQHACIVYAENNGMTTPWHFSGGQPHDTERKAFPARIAIGDGEGQVTAVLAGLGIAQLPSWLIKQQLDQGTLVEVLPELTTEGLPINLAWQKSRQTIPRISAFLDILSKGLSPSGSNLSAV